MTIRVEDGLLRLLLLIIRLLLLSFLIIVQVWSNNNFHENYECAPFFHAACMNKYITLEIIQYLLDEFPQVVEVTDEYEESYSYPLHTCCYNNHCPSDVIELVMKRYPSALGKFDMVEMGFYCHDFVRDIARGLPLHYYLARGSNVDIETVRILVEEYPQSLLAIDGDMQFLPIHAILSNPNVHNLQNILAYLIEREPSSIYSLDGRVNRTPLHIACSNKGVTLKVFRLVYNAWPEAFTLGSGFFGFHPIHELCFNTELDEIVSLDILRCMFHIDPACVRERNFEGGLPIHTAAKYSPSINLCKELIKMYPESLRVEESNSGSLPIHEIMCHNGYNLGHHIHIIRYFLDVYPESIDARDNNGWLPIHRAIGEYNSERREETIKLLLIYDPSAASKKTADVNCRLPLHIACKKSCLGMAQLLYDAYPEAIWTRDVDGETPLDIAKRAAQSRNPSNIVSFVEAQMMIAPANVQSIHLWSKFYTRTQNGGTGSLPLHRALNNNATLGAIKLLVKGNPESLQVANNQGSLPLHIACEFSSVKVVQFLLELNGNDSCLDHLDIEGNSPLHYACRGGSYNTVKYLLERNASSVSERNADGKLPIHLLCEAEIDEVGEESTQYVEAIWLLLLANPTGVMT